MKQNFCTTAIIVYINIEQNELQLQKRLATRIHIQLPWLLEKKYDVDLKFFYCLNK